MLVQHSKTNLFCEFETDYRGCSCSTNGLPQVSIFLNIRASLARHKNRWIDISDRSVFRNNRKESLSVKYQIGGVSVKLENQTWAIPVHSRETVPLSVMSMRPTNELGLKKASGSRRMGNCAIFILNFFLYKYVL